MGAIKSKRHTDQKGTLYALRIRLGNVSPRSTTNTARTRLNPNTCQ